MREGIEDPVFTGKINLDFDDKNITFSIFFVYLVKEVLLENFLIIKKMRNSK